MTFGIQYNLPIRICRDSIEATAQGFTYRRPTYLPMEIKQAVVVQGGTVEGNPTVDFIMVDEKGQQYVVMITGRLIETLVRAAFAKSNPPVGGGQTSH